MYFICVLLYRKRPVATGVNQFPAVLLYFPNCETGNQKNPKSGQPQPVVRLHPVASGPVSVFFLVHATGLADTIPDIVHICLCYEDGCSTYNVVTIGLINTGPSEWHWFFVFSRNHPFNKICSVFHTCILGIRIPKVLNSCDCSHCKASMPFV